MDINSPALETTTLHLLNTAPSLASVLLGGLLDLLDGLCHLLLDGTPALLAPALLLFDALDRFLLEATPAPLHLLRKLLPEFLQSPPTLAVCLLELLNTAPSLASVLLGGLLDLLRHSRDLLCIVLEFIQCHLGSFTIACLIGV